MPYSILQFFYCTARFCYIQLHWHKFRVIFIEDNNSSLQWSNWDQNVNDIFIATS